MALAESAPALICKQLRQLIVTLDPDCVELTWPRLRMTSYGVGPRKLTQHYAYIAAQSAHVNLGFYHGTSLHDPAGVLEGTGKKLRHIKLRECVDCEAPALVALLVEAISDRKPHADAPADAVTLEPRKMAHAEELFAILAEPCLYDFIDEAPPASVEALRQKLARSESRKSPDGTQHWLNWVVRDASRQMIGYVQATIFANGETNVAYVIGSAFWGRGLGSVAVERMLQMVAAKFDVAAFFIVAEQANVRSVRLARKLGFTPAPPEDVARHGIGQSDVLLRRGVDQTLQGARHDRSRSTTGNRAQRG